jgi:SAM-dependent methyltransferase
MVVPPAKYRKAFYRSLESQGLISAREILPFVFDIFHPKSIVDVGCGSGEWLSVCQELGVQDITGFDFHSGAILKIPKDNFITHDLTQPIKHSRTYDVALSFEVGEHLAPERAESFVRSITQLAPVVLFSAAIPSQGGTGHVNEQWPSYWAGLFERFDFVPVDCVRRRFWEHGAITCYYTQNSVLYLRRDILPKYELLTRLPSFSLLPLVHPGLFGDQAKELKQLRPLFTARGLVKRLPGALWLSISDRIRRVFDR